MMVAIIAMTTHGPKRLLSNAISWTASVGGLFRYRPKPPSSSMSLKPTVPRTEVIERAPQPIRQAIARKIRYKKFGRLRKQR
jgi:hypothetical protein